jgi:hypothetical protein
MNQQQLTLDEAKQTAGKFLLMPGFPRAPVAVEELAKVFLDLCHGRIIAGVVWSAKDQALWLFSEARDNWTDWEKGGGVVGLRALFSDQFASFRKGQLRCSSCDDAGVVFEGGVYRMCTCRIGRMIHPNSAADLNALMQEPPPAEPTQPVARETPPAAAPLRPITQADIDRAKAKVKKGAA